MKDIDEVKEILKEMGFTIQNLPLPGYPQGKKHPCYVDSESPLKVYCFGNEAHFHGPKHYISIDHFGEHSGTGNWTKEDFQKHVEAIREKARKTTK
ncbi:MAG: hypothetical protein GTN36_00300 [Candidatus Aenigmarchaeota archaeon]|nr:hypothetical protein [Candidatus Aenigmarchaeota archaeon]